MSIINESRLKIVGPIEALDRRVRELEEDISAIKALVLQNNITLQDILDAVEAEKAKT